MREGAFYASAMTGLPSLIARWLEIGDASPDRLGIILADTARIAKLGEPATDPDGATLERWAAPREDDERAPLWAVKAALFLLSQMPARPCPQSAAQRDGWAWAWLRLRRWESLEQARDALPGWLREALGDHLQRGWQDRQRQRLL